MSDSVKDTSSSSWFERIGQSIAGIFFGLVLLLIGVGLLFWNEGRAVKAYKSLEEGMGIVLDISSDQIDPANEGKLVHLTAEAIPSQEITDLDFGISVDALRFKRNVEMFQWEQTETKETQKKLGGGEETVTTYSYKKVWSSQLNDSSSFNQAEGHENPVDFPYPSTTWDAEEVSVGAFYLTQDLLTDLVDFQDYPLMEVPSDSNWPEDARLLQGGIYLGDNPDHPMIGDTRITYSIIKPGPVSLVAMQNGDSFLDYQTTEGESISLIQPGNIPAKQMFNTAMQDNQFLTWMLRLAGIVVLWIGFALILAPLSVLADVVPIIGDILGAATGFVSLLLALVVSMVVIALAWFVFRPILGMALLVVGASAGFLLLRTARKKTQPA